MYFHDGKRLENCCKKKKVCSLAVLTPPPLIHLIMQLCLQKKFIWFCFICFWGDVVAAWFMFTSNIFPSWLSVAFLCCTGARGRWLGWIVGVQSTDFDSGDCGVRNVSHVWLGLGKKNGESGKRWWLVDECSFNFVKNWKRKHVLSYASNQSRSVFNQECPGAFFNIFKLYSGINWGVVQAFPATTVPGKWQMQKPPLPLRLWRIHSLEEMGTWVWDLDSSAT